MTPDIGLYICIGGMSVAFLSIMVGIVVVLFQQGQGWLQALLGACMLLFPTSLFVSFIGFILMCYGFTVQILATPS